MLGNKIKLLTITLLTLLSTVTLSAQSITVAYEATVEPGQTYLFGDKALSYSAAGVYYESRTIPRKSLVGDSTINLTLYVCTDITVAYEATVEVGQTYLFGDMTLTPTSTADMFASRILPRTFGCDSTINLTLHAVEPCSNITVAYEATVQVGQTYLFGDQTLSYATAGDYPATQTLKRAGSECDSIINLTLHVVPACENITVAYEATVEVGQTYLFGDQTLSYATAGDYPATQTLKRAGTNCDSIINLTLHVVVPCEDITVAYDAEIEAGQTYLFGDVAYHYGDSETGLYVLTRTIPRVGGCDSTIILNLTVKAGGGGTCEDITVAYEATITLGQTYLFGDKAITPTAVGDVTDQRTIKRENYDCDSIINLTLHVVVPCEDITVAYEATVEVGQTYLFGDQALSYADPGDYPATQTIKRQGNNCDSIINLTLHVIVPCEDITVAYETTIEPNQTYLFGDQALTYPLEGDYNATKTIKRVGTDCDSIINLTIHVVSPCPATIVVEDTVATVCAIDLPFMWHGMALYRDTVNCDDTLRNVTAQGCDSIVRLKLTVNAVTYTPDGTDDIIICDGDTYTWPQNNKDYDAQGIYFDTVPNPLDDCDSLVYTLNLTVQSVKLDTVMDVAICSGDSYEWKVDGRVIGTYDKEGIYHDTIRYAALNVNNTHCDSALFTLNLSFHGEAPVKATVDTVCASNLPYEWVVDGVTLGTYDKEGDYTVTRKYAGASCDSVKYTLKLKIDSVAAEDYHTNSVSVYYGYPFEWRDGQEYIITTDTVFYKAYKHAGTHGCDSAIYRTYVTVLDIPRENIDVTDIVCAGDVYPAKGGDRLIVSDSTWVDSIRVIVDEVPTDKFYHYTIYVYGDLTQLPDSLIDDVRAVCGSPLDTAVAEAKIRQYLVDTYETLHLDPESEIKWYVNRAGQFVPRASEIITGSEVDVDFHVVVTDRCDNEVTLGNIVIVEDPEVVYKANILVEKYGHWLMMLHVNSLVKEGFVFDEDDIDWYQVVNGVDTKLDHKGYYYTSDEELVGQFYVIINTTTESGCNAAIRSNTVDWSKPLNAPMRLVPNIGPEGTMMKLENINPTMESTIYTYDEAGSMLWQTTVNGQVEMDIRAEGIPGIYMLRVVTGDKVQTLRYVIK